MRSVDESQFASARDLRAWTAVMGNAGLRSTGSAAHHRVTEWLSEMMSELPGVRVRSDNVDLLAWQPCSGASLQESASLRLIFDEDETTNVAVAGAVPYSASTSDPPPRAEVIYLPPNEPISVGNSRGKVVIRDVAPTAVPMEMLQSLAIFQSSDAFLAARGAAYSRPFLFPFHDELMAAVAAGAHGVVFAFGVDSDAVSNYFDPHGGTHYPIPAAFVGREARDLLLAAAEKGAEAEIIVRAETRAATARNIYATLPGQSEQRIVIVSHSDGATWVQENGPAALLALARHFSTVPITDRPYTLEFAITSAHLHMSKEGSHQYASLLNAQYEGGSVAAVVALEHLGAREILPDVDGALQFTGRGELLLWAVGPSAAMRHQVEEAARQRKLDAVLVAPGFGRPKIGHAPEFGSFGGIGSYYHAQLIPTMAVVSGPWSLWAPAFGESAIDFERMRSQVLAIADVVDALGQMSPSQIAGDYARDRAARAAGAPGQLESLPPEVIGLP